MIENQQALNGNIMWENTGECKRMWENAGVPFLWLTILIILWC